MGVRRFRLAERAVAVTGVVVAHVLAYAVATPEVGHHHGAGPGHGYWPVAVGAGLAGAAVALTAAVIRGAGRVLRRHTAADEEGPGTLLRLTRLTSWQVALAVAMEASEHVAVRAPLGGLLHSPQFRLLLLLQVVVAATSLFVLRIVERLSACVARALVGRARLRRPPSFGRQRPAGFVAATVPGLVRSRAPPVLPLT